MDDTPCGHCAVGLYALDVSAPSQRFARKPASQRERFMPRCRMDRSRPCIGAQDLHAWLVADPEHQEIADRLQIKPEVCDPSTDLAQAMTTMKRRLAKRRGSP